MGFYQADEGDILVDGHSREIRSPYDAYQLGIGMVYQHFTLVPAMTVAENLVLSRPDLPAIIRWKEEMERLQRIHENRAVPGRSERRASATRRRRKTESGNTQAALSRTANF